MVCVWRLEGGGSKREGWMVLWPARAEKSVFLLLVALPTQHTQPALGQYLIKVYC